MKCPEGTQAVIIECGCGKVFKECVDLSTLESWKGPVCPVCGVTLDASLGVKYLRARMKERAEERSE